MKEIDTREKNLRAAAYFDGKIYYSVYGQNTLHAMDIKGTKYTAIPLGFEATAIKLTGDNVLIAGAMPPAIYRMDKNFNRIDVIHYLRAIPPKLLPSPPYHKYITGIAVEDNKISFVLQNSGKRYFLDEKNAFVSHVEIPPDTFGFDLLNGEPIFSDMAEGCLKYREKKAVLKTGFRPYSVCAAENAVYVSSLGSGKIAVLKLSSFQ